MSLPYPKDLQFIENDVYECCLLVENTFPQPERARIERNFYSDTAYQS